MPGNNLQVLQDISYKLNGLGELSNLTLAFQNQLGQMKQLIRDAQDISQLKIDVTEIKGYLDQVETKLDSVVTAVNNLSFDTRNAYYQECTKGGVNSKIYLEATKDIWIYHLGIIIGSSQTIVIRHEEMSTITYAYMTAGTAHVLTCLNTGTDGVSVFLRHPLFLESGKRLELQYGAATTLSEFDVTFECYGSEATLSLATS